MNRCRGIGVLVLLAAACASAVQAQPGTLEMEVDCDRGDSLYRALRRAERAGTARIQVRGTCGGAQFLASDNWVEILGDPAGGTILQSGANPVLTVSGPGTLELRDLRMIGGMGLRASGNRRVVHLTDCEIESQSLGVFADWGSSVFIENSGISALDTAVYAVDAQVVVRETRLHDSTFAARSFRGSVWFDHVEALNNEIGVLVEDRSNLVVLGGRFERNGQGHLGATTDSRLSLYNVQIGGPGDPTALSLNGNTGATIETYFDDPTVDVWGPVNLLHDSFMSLEGGTLHGSIQLRDFSRLSLEATVDGGVGCDSAADVWCGSSATATTNGCPSAPQVCTPSTRDALAPPAMPRVPPRPPQIIGAPREPEGHLSGRE